MSEAWAGLDSGTFRGQRIVEGTLDVAAVETEHVLRILQPLWSAKPGTGSRVRGRLPAPDIGLALRTGKSRN